MKALYGTECTKTFIETAEKELRELRAGIAPTKAAPWYPTARNNPRPPSLEEIRDERHKRIASLEKRIRHLRGELSLCEMLDEIRAHTRVQSAELTSLWLMQKPSMHAQLCTRGWRLDIRCTDGSEHEVTLSDPKVTAQDIVDQVLEALDMDLDDEAEGQG